MCSLYFSRRLFTASMQHLGLINPWLCTMRDIVVVQASIFSPPVIDDNEVTFTVHFENIIPTGCFGFTVA